MPGLGGSFSFTRICDLKGRPKQSPVTVGYAVRSVLNTVCRILTHKRNNPRSIVAVEDELFGTPNNLPVDAHHFRSRGLNDATAEVAVAEIWRPPVHGQVWPYAHGDGRRERDDPI